MYMIRCIRALFLKFSFFFLTGFSVYGMFDSSMCLNSSFESKVSHAGFPFGLTENTLHVRKIKCLIEINFYELFYWQTRWIIDVCREPIHIKLGKRSTSVIRRHQTCPHKDDAFCEEFSKLKHIIQDSGLIFAKGEKGRLSDDHGKIYCSYLLLEKYLRKGDVLGPNHFEMENFWQVKQKNH